MHSSVFALCSNRSESWNPDSTQFDPSAPEADDVVLDEEFAEDAFEARAAYPSKFGRGWIPAGRDIGLPGEFLPGTGRGTSVAGGGARASGRDDEGWRPPHLPLHHPADGPAGAEPRIRLPRSGEERTPRETDFTPPRRALFLHHLAEQGNVRVACSRVRVSPQAAYLARRRDPLFRAGWEAALVHARAWSEQVLANVALEGARVTTIVEGVVVREVIRTDARLLLAHMARLDAKAVTPRTEANAARFDELLALVAGAELPEPMRRYGEAGPLPLDRGAYAARRSGELYDEMADGPEEIPPEHEDMMERDCETMALREWDEWDDQVAAVEAALDVGEEWVAERSSPSTCDGEGDHPQDGGGAQAGDTDLPASGENLDSRRGAEAQREGESRPQADHPYAAGCADQGDLKRLCRGDDSSAPPRLCANNPETPTAPVDAPAAPGPSTVSTVSTSTTCTEAETSHDAPERAEQSALESPPCRKKARPRGRTA